MSCKTRCGLPLRIQIQSLFLHVYLIGYFVSTNTGSSINQTEEILLKNGCFSQTKSFVAVNVTITPTKNLLFCIFQFIPARNWINYDADNVLNTTAFTQLFKNDHLNPIKNISFKPEQNLEELLDLSLWVDRSVLIVAVHYHKLNLHHLSCPQLYICALPETSLVAPIYSRECHIGLGEISGHCMETVLSPHYFLFHLAVGISVSIDRVSESEVTSDSSVNFVATAGYRLAPGKFTCPPGLFACDLVHSLNEQRHPQFVWDYRICLPVSLWCDGVPNCPQSASDEKHCERDSFGNLVTHAPISFPTNDSMAIKEMQMFERELSRIARDEFLLALAGYDASALVWHSSGNAGMISISVISTFLICFGVICLILCWKYSMYCPRRNQKRKPSENINKISSPLMHNSVIV